MLILTSNVGGQEYKKGLYRIGLTSGIGYYIQNDLHELNKEVQKGLEFNTELVDNFPANMFFGSYLLFSLSPEIYAGINYEFHTTGSRLGTKDFSGSYAFDQIISCHSIAFELEQSLTLDKKLDFILDIKAGANFAEWEMTEKIIIGEQEEKSSTKINGIKAFIFPSFKIKYPIIKKFNFSLLAGYHLEIFGKYKYRGNEVEKTPKFTGPRASLSLDFEF